MDYQIDSDLARDFQQACSADDARDNPMLRRTIIVIDKMDDGTLCMGNVQELSRISEKFQANPRIRRAWRRESAKVNKFLWKFYDKAGWKTPKA